MKQQFEAIDHLAETLATDTPPSTHEAARPSPLAAVTVGRILAIAPHAGPLVDFPANRSCELLLARSLVAIGDAQIGDEVALVFEDGEWTRPIILGVFHESSARPPDSFQPASAPTPVEVQRDQDRLLLTADREITLRCGKASITLTSAGKVLLRGAYLLSRSSGVNRIKGGSVQIN
jgi:hypothetical protein